jgi:zinc protease
MTRLSSSRWTADVHREVLPNGLTLLVQRDASAPAVAVVTHVRAGFFDEPDRWIGISHVLEHMFFKGTARRGVGAIARETKSAGGYLNASTTYDHTTYYTVLPAGSLAAALDLQSDALRNSLIDSGELARELEVIIQEARRKLDTPSAVAQETLHEVMFDRHRIRRWRIGREEALRQLTRDDLWAYYRSRYVPERVVVAIVGAVDVAEAAALAGAHYADWAAAPGAVDPSPVEPPRAGVRSRTLRADVVQGELILGWRGVTPLHPDAAPLDLAAAMLASGRGSRLHRALRETGLATAVYAHHYSPTELGVFSVGADLGPDHVEVALPRIAEEISSLALLGPAPAELERARTLLLTRWARTLETTDGRGAALGMAETLGGVDVLDREFAALAEASADAVGAAVARYLRPEDVSAVLSLPAAEGADLAPERLAAAFAVSALRPPAPLEVPAPRVPPPRPSRRSETAGVAHAALAGIDLLVRAKPGVPTVTLGLYTPRVTFDPPDQAGIAGLAIRSGLRGAGGYGAAELAYAIERLGGSFAPSITLDWLGYSTAILADHVAPAAGLLSLLLTAPSHADKEVLAERALLIEETRQATDDMFRHPFQLAFASAFGRRGYGLPSLGLPETLANVAPADVRAWHRDRLLAGRPALIAVGDLEPAAAIDQLAGVFEHLGSRPDRWRPEPEEWLPGPLPREERVQRQKAQSAFAMLYPGLRRADPGYAAVEVWAAIASGLGGRLFESLRDRRSLAYTVLALAWGRGRTGALATYIATSPGREREARVAMLAELERFACELVSEAELRQAISYLAGQAQVERQSSAAVVTEILEAWIVGRGLEDLADPGARFRAVTAEQVLAVAGSLDPSRRVEGVVEGCLAGR